jgi:hypothetical protein
MRKLLMVSLLVWTAMMGLGQPRSASALTSGVGTCPSGSEYLQVLYYDCSTGSYCGYDSYLCDPVTPFVHSGCTTTCQKFHSAHCTCAIQDTALGSTPFESAATPWTLSCKTDEEPQPTWITG